MDGVVLQGGGEDGSLQRAEALRRVRRVDGRGSRVAVADGIEGEGGVGLVAWPRKSVRLGEDRREGEVVGALLRDLVLGHLAAHRARVGARRVAVREFFRVDEVVAERLAVRAVAELGERGRAVASGLARYRRVRGRRGEWAGGADDLLAQQVVSRVDDALKVEGEEEAREPQVNRAELPVLDFNTLRRGVVEKRRDVGVEKVPHAARGLGSVCPR